MTTRRQRTETTPVTTDLRHLLDPDDAARAPGAEVLGARFSCTDDGTNTGLSLTYALNLKLGSTTGQALDGWRVDVYLVDADDYLIDRESSDVIADSDPTRGYANITWYNTTQDPRPTRVRVIPTPDSFRVEPPRLPSPVVVDVTGPSAGRLPIVARPAEQHAQYVIGRADVRYRGPSNIDPNDPEVHLAMIFGEEIEPPLPAGVSVQVFYLDEAGQLLESAAIELPAGRPSPRVFRYSANLTADDGLARIVLQPVLETRS